MNRILCVAVMALLFSASFLLQRQSAASNGFNFDAADFDAADSFDFDAAELTDKSLWTQVNAEPYHISSELDGLCRAPTSQDYQVIGERTGNPHMVPSIIVYVNKVGKEAMFAKQPQFPVGSVIVKKKLGTYHERYQPLLYTVMRKRKAGYNPAVGDWEFSVVGADGKQLQASGKLENCQSCHVSKKDTDFIFRPYVKLE